MKQTGDWSRDSHDGWLAPEEIGRGIDDGKHVGVVQTALLGKELAQHLDAHSLFAVRALFCCARADSVFHRKA